MNEHIPSGRGWMLARLLIFAAIFGMGGFLYVASSTDFPVTTRVVAAVGAAICLAFPARILYVGARRYYRTGSWTASLEERRAWRKRYAGWQPRPWFFPAMTALFVLTAMLNTIAAAIRVHRYQLTVGNGLYLVFWLLFFVAQCRQLYQEMRKSLIT